MVLPIYATIADRYKPDTFVVVHEPTTMSSRMRSKATPEEWAAFARESARVVKERSPKTRIGAGGLDTEERYYNAFAELPEIEVMTLDIYNLRNLPTFQRMVQTAKKNGKGVYIEETWRPPYFTRAFGQTLDRIVVQNVGDRSFEDLDVSGYGRLPPGPPPTASRPSHRCGCRPSSPMAARRPKRSILPT